MPPCPDCVPGSCASRLHGRLRRTGFVTCGGVPQGKSAAALAQEGPLDRTVVRAYLPFLGEVRVLNCTPARLQAGRSLEIRAKIVIVVLASEVGLILERGRRSEMLRHRSAWASRHPWWLRIGRVAPAVSR